MVLSMSNTNQPHLPQRITVTMKFNFNSIFYVRYKSEEISPAVIFLGPTYRPLLLQKDIDLNSVALALFGQVKILPGKNPIPT